MTTASVSRLFVSYAHKDGSQLAVRLSDDLRREGYTVWIDTARLKGGTSWTTEIELALERSDVVLAILSRGAFDSDMCRAEHLRSLRKGKCVIPILGQPNVDCPLYLEAKQFRDLSSDLTYRDEFVNLLQDIGHRSGGALTSSYRHTYVTVPPLPVNYVDRRNELETLRSAVLDDGSSRRIALTALKGMAGVGKTILAQALCLDETIQSAFPDGVIWLNVGKGPRDLLPLFREAARAAGDSLEGYDNVQSASNQLRNYLREKAVLLVLDDIWDSRDAAPFVADSPRSRLLITTRDARTAVSLGARQQALDVLNHEQSLELVALWADCPVSGLPPEAEEIVQECGCLPLALAMVGALLRGKTNRWTNVLHKLRNADLDRIRQSFPEYPHPDLLRAIDVSLDALEDNVRDRYLAFAVFPEDTPIAEAAVKTLWGLGQYDLEDTLDQLVDLSLVTREKDGRIGIHDLLLDYLRHRLGVENLKEAHNRLLQSYAGLCPGHWSDGPRDGYFFENLTWHLRKAGRTDEAMALITDFRWIHAKLRACGVTSALMDYEWCASTDPGARLTQEALRLSAHVLAVSVDQLAGQLLARLQVGRSSVTDRLRIQASEWRGGIWLRPLRSLLTAPGGSLMFTLVGHASRVRSVALTPNGQRAISGSDDGTVKVWDLRRGVLERTLTGHTDWVRAVAVLGNGERVVSASDDRTLRVWHVATGKEACSVHVHAWIRALIGLLDGKRVASISDDRVAIWNLDQGTVESTLRDHSAEVNCIALSPDGQSLISGGSDHVLRIWRFDQDGEVRVLKGHRAKVTAVSTTPDGQSILSASAEGSVLLWDIRPDAKSLFKIVANRTNGVRSLATTPDGRSFIFASDDHTLHIWSLTDGGERVLEGHSDRVNSVAVTPDGRCAVSASDDGSLKVWDLTRAAQPVATREHSDRILALEVMPNGENALSSSEDHTMRVWDVKTGASVKTIENFQKIFTITPDGSKVVSGGMWGSCQVWDCRSELQLQSFERHTDRIVSIAVTPDGARVLSSSDDSTMRLWNIDTAEEYLTIQLSRYWPRSLAISPDSRFALTAGNGTHLILWDLQTGSEVRSYQGHKARVNAVAASSSWQFAASGSDDHTLRVWDVESGKTVRVIEGHLARVTSVAFSPSGSFIVSASEDCELKLWKVSEGEALTSFTTESPLFKCAVSSREPVVVAGDQSGYVHFFVVEGVPLASWIGGKEHS